MNNEKIHDFTSFIPTDKIGHLLITYQSIKGKIRKKGKSIKFPFHTFVELYDSDQVICQPFYKNISKIHVK